MITRAKLDAFLAAARDLGVSSINYQSAEPDHPREIVSITMPSRGDAFAAAAALEMHEPRDLDIDAVAMVFSNRSEPGLGISVSSRPEVIEHPVALAAGDSLAAGSL